MSDSEIDEVSRYLLENYYAKYKGKRADVVPTLTEMRLAFLNHGDKLVVVRDEKIKGVGIFITLTDETYAKLNEIDITSTEILFNLLTEFGDNLHFVLLCADGYKTIMTGIRYALNLKKPKTISWWNPDLTKLHRYHIKDLMEVDKWQQQSRSS